MQTKGRMEVCMSMSKRIIAMYIDIDADIWQQDGADVCVSLVSFLMYVSMWNISVYADIKTPFSHREGKVT